MKLFIISDVHGDSYCLEKALEIYGKEKPDYIIILGDMLYHGPRNGLPGQYDTKKVAELINPYKNKIVAVRGNCDSEVDQVMLEYPMMSDYTIILYENRKLFLTHGHIYNENKLPNLGENDVLMYGHFHVPIAKKVDGIYILNPGSLSIPRGNNPNSYAIIENDIFQIKDFEQNIIKEIKLENKKNIDFF